MTTITRLSPGDRVLVTFDSDDADTIHDAIRELKERFPGVQFVGLSGATSIAVQSADIGTDDVTTLDVPDSPKMLRETLNVAQTCIGRSPHDESEKWKHIDRLSRLVQECDRHRPLGPDGNHGDRHTPTCGCLEVPDG